MWQIVLNGPGYLDTAYDLPEGEIFLGRGDDNQVVLAGELVSRRHARMVVRGGELLVEDAGSRNGTGVNGVVVDGATPLHPGDIVDIGENQLLVREAESRRDESTILVRWEQSVSLERIERARALDALDHRPEIAALVLLYKVSERLASAPSLERFLEEVADLVLEVARARTVVVQLAHPPAEGADAENGSFIGADGYRLEPAVVRHQDELAAGEVPISRSVVEECMRTGAALCVEDVARDARFSGSESVIHYGASQVICAPLMRSGAVHGLIYITREADDAALQPLVDAIAALAHLAGTGIEQQRLRERAAAEERIRMRFSRFLGAGIAAELAADLADGVHMEEREATLLFADISGFTQLTERLPAKRVVALLDEFYRRMARVIFSFGGTVDKFMGDAVMAIFGAPRSSGDDASRALRAALAMRADFDEMMASWPRDERCQLKIGLNTGRVLAGTVGGDERLEYTAVGDAVNVAARLVGQAAPGQIIAGAATLEAAGCAFDTRALGTRQVRGRKVAVDVVELLGEEAAA